MRTKPQVILDFTSGDLRFQSITTDDVRVRVHGNPAVDTGGSTMDGQDKGKAVPHDTRFTRVWDKAARALGMAADRYHLPMWRLMGTFPANGPLDDL